jgi:hypothetical protein
MHRLRSTAQKFLFLRLVFISALSLSKPQGLVLPQTLGKLKIKFIHLIRTQSRDLPAYSIVPQLCCIYRMYLL